MPNTEYSVAEAKKHFSEILGRVAYAGERILISKRGKPVAVIIPPEPALREDRLSKVEGWLDDADPFFRIMSDIATDREKRIPRALRKVTQRGKDVSA